MNRKTQNAIIALLCVVILVCLTLTVYSLKKEQTPAANPNATIVEAPEQEGFEVHPEWVIPEVEPIDYGENLALGKEVRQNGQTQIYNCRNVNDGDRFTYWEGAADAYPNKVTIEMGAPTELTGFRILLNPRQNWSARTQDVSVEISGDGERFETAVERTTLSFDPLADNSAYVAFPEKISAQYIRFTFYANTGATAGQAAEIELYAGEVPN